MAIIEEKLASMGLVLPQALMPPAGVTFSFTWARVHGCRVFLSGDIAHNSDGSIAHPLGKVGAEVTPEQAYQSARLVALAHLGSLKRAIGDLDRVTAWLRVFAAVNAAPGFYETPRATNGYSDLIVELYGQKIGVHARTSPCLQTPLNAPVLCEAEVEIDGGQFSQAG